MSNQIDIVVGVDPGVYGGVSILYKNGKIHVHRIPIGQVVINKKNKKVYNLPAIAKLLKPLENKKVLFVQEKVASHPGEGSVSAFSFGKSAGATIGMAFALEFEVAEISSINWKKYFPLLVNDEIRDKKEETKQLRVLGKTLKDKKAKKENKKQIDKLNRQIKTISKTLARELAISLYPKLADTLKQKNSDGMAESLLIAIYGRENKDELVQKC